MAQLFFLSLGEEREREKRGERQKRRETKRGRGEGYMGAGREVEMRQSFAL